MSNFLPLLWPVLRWRAPLQRTQRNPRVAGAPVGTVSSEGPAVRRVFQEGRQPKQEENLLPILPDSLWNERASSQAACHLDHRSNRRSDEIAIRTESGRPGFCLLPLPLARIACCGLTSGKKDEAALDGIAGRTAWVLRECLSGDLPWRVQRHHQG